MKLNFRSLEERIVFDGSFSKLNNDFSFLRQEEQTIPINQEILAQILEELNNPFEVTENLINSDNLSFEVTTETDISEESNASVEITENPSPLRHLIQASGTNSYRLQGLFYRGDVENFHFNNLLIRDVPEFDFPLQENHSYSISIQQEVHSIEFYAIYGEYSQAIPIIIEDSFFSYPLSNMSFVTQIIDTMLHQTSEIILNEVQEAIATRIQICMETKSIFRYLEHLKQKNISRIDYQILPHRSSYNDVLLDILIFDFSIKGVVNEENSTQSTSSLIEIKKGNAYYLQGNFYLSSIKNESFNNIRIKILPQPDHPLEYSSFYSRTVDSGFGPIQLYAVYPQHLDHIPIHIGVDFFYFDYSNIQLAAAIIDMMLGQSSEIILQEIQETEARNIEITIETESIFPFVQNLQEKNISTIDYQMVTERFRKDGSSIDSLMFHFCMNGMQNNQIVQ